MGRAMRVATTAGLALWLIASGAAAAHEPGEEKLEVEPSSVTAGESVIVAGSGLEADSDRVLLLAGENLIVEFGTVTTDAEGMFNKEVTIPSHLPPGTYEFRAIGDETLTVPLGILEPAAMASPQTGGATPAPSSMPASSAGSGTESPVPAPTAAPIDPTKTVVLRERTPLDMALIGVFVLFAAAIGGLLVVRAERLGGSSWS